MHCWRWFDFKKRIVELWSVLLDSYWMLLIMVRWKMKDWWIEIGQESLLSIDAIQVIQNLQRHHKNKEIIQLLDSIQTVILNGKPKHGAHEFNCMVWIDKWFIVPRIIPKLVNTKTVVIVPRTKRNQNTHPVVEKRLSSDCAVRFVVNHELLEFRRDWFFGIECCNEEYSVKWRWYLQLSLTRIRRVTKSWNSWKITTNNWYTTEPL